jgi:hypothetical protein
MATSADLQSRLAKRPRMVRWFSPSLLLRTLAQVVLSGWFGRFSDRRLMIAALDKSSPDEIRRQCDIRDDAKADSEGAIWIDYVADVGDGFDSTYAIATLLARSELRIGKDALPRGQVLIFGGDEVYPTASRENYRRSMQDPYGLAFPDAPRDRPHPLFFALPGNHDWYDGLVTFLALFCREKPLKLGSWRSRQRRSYFAIRISDDWWIWGADIQLVEDVDQPQADYFKSVATGMELGSKIILCSATPDGLT